MKVWKQVVRKKQFEIDRFDNAYFTHMERFADNKTTYRCVICDETLPNEKVIAVEHRDLGGRAFVHVGCANETTMVLVKASKIKRIQEDREITRFLKMKEEVEVGTVDIITDHFKDR